MNAFLVGAAIWLIFHLAVAMSYSEGRRSRAKPPRTKRFLDLLPGAK
jgi:hypothetical protein